MSRPLAGNLLRKYPTVTSIGVLTFMLLVAYWKLTLMQGTVITDDIFTSDIMNDSFPLRSAMGEILRHGELPLWLPHIYGGIPLLARAESGVCYPPNVVLFSLLPPYAALNYSLLLTLILAAAGMFLLARELSGSIAGGLAAGMAFAFSGYMVSHLKHMSNVGSICWFPLGLLLIELAAKRSDARQLLWLSIIFGLQILAGHIQVAYYSGIVYVAYALFRFLGVRSGARGTKRRKVDSSPAPARRLVLAFMLAMTLGAGIGALQLLPTYEMVQLSQRSGGVTFDYAANYAYDPANVITFFAPYARGDISDATYRGTSIFWEDYGYVGLLTMVLALVGVVRSWRKPHVKFFAFTAVVSYILVLGPNTPVYELVFNVVPGMKYFRFPTRFLFIVDASLCVLAAYGLGAVREMFRRSQRGEIAPARPNALELCIVAAVVAELVYFQMRQNAIVDLDKWLEPPKTVQKLREDTGVYRIYSPGASEVHKAVFGLAKGWSGDLQPYLDQREFIQPSSNVLYNLSTSDGYAQLTPGYIVDIWGDQNRGGLILKTASLQEGKFIPQPSFLRIMDLFNVKYLLAPWPIVTGRLEHIATLRGVFVYRNPSVQERSFVVGSYRLASGPDAAKSILLSADFDPTREAILYERPNPDLEADSVRASAAILRYGTNEVVLSVESSGAGLLVFSDTYYPGWRAEVDGVERPILKANLCQRGVQISGGKHTVTFRFSSLPVKAGFGIAAVSLLVVAAGLVMYRKNIGGNSEKG